MKLLKKRDVLALGLMALALFIGAGNVIYPPMVGLQSGSNVWIAATGFLITAVGFPIITVIVLAKEGSIEGLTRPIGKKPGIALASISYLAVGPLFAIPRTATVSFEVGVVPLLDNGAITLFLYSLAYFVAVFSVSFYPGHLLDTVGRFLAPMKILALAFLGIAAVIFPAARHAGNARLDYITDPFSQGFIKGYLTMDTLGALVFGLVVVRAIRSRGVDSPKLITRYAIISGLISGIGLCLIYATLFQLGSRAYNIASGSTNGAAILHAYVQYTFGSLGSVFLSIVITLACLVTAVGLTCACAEYFSNLIRVSYRKILILLTMFSLIISNLGLTQLIAFSTPILTAIYPPCIVVILLSLSREFWKSEKIVIAPATLTSFIFGSIDALESLGIHITSSNYLSKIPLSTQGLSWLVPSTIVFFACAVYDILLKDRRTSSC